VTALSTRRGAMTDLHDLELLLRPDRPTLSIESV